MFFMTHSINDLSEIFDVVHRTTQVKEQGYIIENNDYLLRVDT